MTEISEQSGAVVDPPNLGEANAEFIEEMGRAADAETRRLGGSTVTVDITFLAFLRRFSRFGYFHFGPIGIDVEIIQGIVERAIPQGAAGTHTTLDDDMVRFSQMLVGELKRTGQRRIGELHYLLTFMRWGHDLPARVFGELGVRVEQVEEFARERNQPLAETEKLYSPEAAADYLGVHVQTVRAWIRAGRLKASRLAGQRALRIRASDLASVLEPVDPDEV
jgi:excisionase family DNA binding protein